LNEIEEDCSKDSSHFVFTPFLGYLSNRTALHWACKRNNAEAVRILLSNGADPTLRNAEGKLAGELSTNASIRSMCGVTEPLEENAAATASDVPDFIPNYLAHPQLSYRVDLGGLNRTPGGRSSGFGTDGN
jgi:hypothetical protein